MERTSGVFYSGAVDSMDTLRSDRMIVYGPIGGTITDTNAVKLDVDSSDEYGIPILSGSIYNNGTSTITVLVQYNTSIGLRSISLPLNPGQAVKLKRVKLHSIQSVTASPSIYYSFVAYSMGGENCEGDPQIEY